MKLNIEINITPKELRKVLGLPDIEKLQIEAIGKIEKKLFKTIDSATDIELLFKRLLPTGIHSSDQFQKLFEVITQLGSKGKSPEKK